MTHTERVKQMLRTRRAVCATAFLEAHMPAARNRVGDLRKLGWVIDSKQNVRTLTTTMTRGRLSTG